MWLIRWAAPHVTHWRYTFGANLTLAVITFLNWWPMQMKLHHYAIIRLLWPITAALNDTMTFKMWLSQCSQMKLISSWHGSWQRGTWQGFEKVWALVLSIVLSGHPHYFYAAHVAYRVPWVSQDFVTNHESLLYQTKYPMTSVWP